MKVLYSLSKQGIKAYNEDISGSSGNFAWVLDGATDIFKEQVFDGDRDVQWYMERLNKSIATVITGNPSLSPSEVLEHAVKQVKCDTGDMKLPDCVLPNFTATILKVDGAKVLLYFLCDCRAYRLHTGEVTRYSDARLQALKVRLGYKETEVLPLATQQCIRESANGCNTYYVGTYSGKGITNGVTLEFDAVQGDRYLLASDGFEIPMTVGLFDEGKLNTAISEFNNHDDCTVLMIEV